jgi:hypothetical protein
LIRTIILASILPIICHIPKSVLKLRNVLQFEIYCAGENREEVFSIQNVLVLNIDRQQDFQFALFLNYCSTVVLPKIAGILRNNFKLK